jgi:hypothetical protein
MFIGPQKTSAAGAAFKKRRMSRLESLNMMYGRNETEINELTTITEENNEDGDSTQKNTEAYLKQFVI